jgi:hypothetical protein
MRVHSRRWFSDVPTCPRKIFAERFDGVLRRRFTGRAGESI